MSYDYGEEDWFNLMIIMFQGIINFISASVPKTVLPKNFPSKFP
jgi:hypothetical protein